MRREVHGEVRFIATGELGRLARWLRLLGYDAVYYTGADPVGAIALAIRQHRVLLTRQGSLRSSKVIPIVQIKDEQIRRQLGQLKRSGLIEFQARQWFERCNVCNCPLVSVPKGRLRGRVPAFTYRTQRRFYRCQRCRRIYWQGSHLGRVRRFLKRLQER